MKLGRLALLVGAAAAAAAPAAAQASAPPPMSAIEPQLVANFTRDQAALRDFEYHEHTVVVKDGVRDARTYHVWSVRGRPIRETIAMDDRQISPAEIEADHERALERAAEALSRPEAAIGTIDFDRHEYPFAKIADDFVYAAPEVRTWNGRTTWVYPARPNPAADRNLAEEVLLAANGEIWVDAEDRHLVRVSIQSFKRFEYFLGLVLTIHHAHLELELQRAAPGLWLPAHADMSYSATAFLVSERSQSKQQTFSDYIRTHAAGN